MFHAEIGEKAAFLCDFWLPYGNHLCKFRCTGCRLAPLTKRITMKDKNIALILSIFLGWLGADRFYLGRPIMGIIKLFTLGGFGILWLVDIIRIMTGRLKPKNGDYSAESVQSCSEDAKRTLRTLTSFAAQKASEQGNPMGSYLAERIQKAVDDRLEKDEN
jgi:TM2 domain-containing membrane protein YozV